jgi:peptidoglycan-associated lipoprotein
MKLMKLILIASTLVWISGCSTLGGTKSDADAANGSDVIVEDRNAETAGVEGEYATGTEYGDGAETQVIAGDEQFQGEGVLDDPNSPLANRVVYFEYDSSSVRQEDVATLEAHAAYLGEHQNVTVRLIGHTDERGSREYNLALGERRALAIRQILMLQGASVKQFEVTSFGEERPAVEGSDEAAWQQNRRVELNYIGR